MKNIIKKYINFSIAIAILFSVSCTKDGTLEADSPNGVGGATARFAISNGHLYTVDNSNLKVFDITDEENPIYVRDLQIGFGIETIFPQGNTLFIGSQWGMVIYDISTPNNPVFLSDFSHVFSCDPVVVEGNYAYVTLSTSNRCNRGTNELQIINIADLKHPVLMEIYPMSNPTGLGIDNELLFICDNGLKVYDASNISDLKLLQTFDIQANDVIPYNGLLFVIGNDGFYQYNYSNGTLSLLSKMEVGTK